MTSQSEAAASDPDNRSITDPLETDFNIEETFFSLTDSRGVIRAGNEVFRRVSGFSWDEMIGAPHKIVRHPDMPKAVFYYFWERLKAGDAVGAYVKNRTKSGGFYWVIAYVTPLADGYLSVRCKPTSPMLDQVKDMYARLRHAELNEKLSPEQSFRNLSAELRKMGYGNYDAFMAEALNSEVILRDEALGHRKSYNLPILADILNAYREIEALGGEMLRSYKAITVAPTNLQVRASRLGDLGQALASISANFTTLTTEMTAKMKSFSELSQEVLVEVDASRIAILSKRLIAQAVEGFEAEDSELDPMAKANALKLFKSELYNYAKKTEGSNDVIKQTLTRFDKIVQEVRQLLSGLSVMRTMSQMEAARLVDEDPSIEMIVNDLRVFHDEALDRLDQIFSRLRVCEKQLAKLFEIARMMADGTIVARTDSAARPHDEDNVSEMIALADAGGTASMAEAW